MKVKRSAFVILGASLLLAGCTKPSESAAPVAKAPAKTMLPAVAASSDSAAAAAPAVAPFVPPPGAPAAVTPTVAAAPKVIVPGSADDPEVLPPGFVPKPIPRQYVVNGQVDLNALTETLRDYCQWRKAVPAELNELVISKYLPNLPEPPAGKKYSIDRAQLAVTLANK